TEKDDCGSYHKTRISLANKLSTEIENSFRPDQCFNLLNSEAHYQSTAREIVQDCDGKLDMVIAPVSTGGQLGGISRYIKKFFPETLVVGVDAQGSAVFGGEAHSYKIPGIGLGWTPVNLDMNIIDAAYKVSDEHAYMMARAMAKHEGVLMGPSSGACMLIAAHYAKKLGKNRRIVCMVADGGDRYIQTLFSDEWLKEQNMDLSTDVELLKKIASEQSPYATDSDKMKNYHPELVSGLSIPITTKTINEEIRAMQSIPSEQKLAALL
ncbi:MAG: cysteine synthase family protein, partial [Pseudobutyrivibrio sp.]|nr:cysteine synthase family protein [Pseudobutyrivibrio sp.]